MPVTLSKENGTVIRDSAVELALAYRVALVKAGGDETLVPIFLPDAWHELAARLASLILVEIGEPGPWECPTCRCLFALPLAPHDPCDRPRRNAGHHD